MVEIAAIQLKRRRKLACFGMGIAAASLLWLFALYLPQCEQIERLRITAAEDRDKIAAVERFMTAHSDLGDYERSVAAQLLVVNQKLPNDLACGAFVAQLEENAQKAQVIVLRLKPDKAAAVGNYIEMPLQVEVQGTYFQLLTFFRKLEQSERFNAVKSMDVQAQDGKLTCRLMVSIYAQDGLKMVKKQENGQATSNFIVE